MEGDFRLWDRFPCFPVLAGEHRECRVRPRRSTRVKVGSGAARAARSLCAGGAFCGSAPDGGRFSLQGQISLPSRPCQGTSRLPSSPTKSAPAKSWQRGSPRRADPSPREGLSADQLPMEGDFRIWDRFPSLGAPAREHRDCRVGPRSAFRPKAGSGAARAARSPRARGTFYESTPDGGRFSP